VVCSPPHKPIYRSLPRRQFPSALTFRRHNKTTIEREQNYKIKITSQKN
jgi:hypothetical protein